MRTSPQLRSSHSARAHLIALSFAIGFGCGHLALGQGSPYAPPGMPTGPSATGPPSGVGVPQPFRGRVAEPVRPGGSQFDPSPQYGTQRGPGAPTPDVYPVRPQQPNAFSSRGFGGQPAIPEPIRGPVFRNPIALHDEQPTQFDPARAARVTLPFQRPPGSGWEDVNQLAATGNVVALQQQIDRRLAGNRSLDGLMTAVTALERANAGAGAVNPYRAQALALAQQQIRSGVQQPLPWLATARFALEDQNDALFRQTTREMVQRFPDNPQAQYFEGVRAVQDQDWATAEKALRKARDLGMSDESLAQLLKLAIDNQRWIWQYAKILTALVVLWLLGLGVIVVLGRILSRRTLRTIRAGGYSSGDMADRWTRSAYQAIVNVASLYYFLSLPMMLALAIALPLALGYALLMTPYLNLWLVAFVLIGGLGGVLTAISGLRTAFVKVPEASLGRSLTANEAPKFWQLVRAVASDVGTRPVDDIWVTPGVDMAVLERGSWRQKMRDTGERVLLIGVGVLPGLKIDAMRAVLAHEYAHFIHRDTAGGDVALPVRSAMNRFIDAIVSRGPVRWWDVTTLFLRFYVPLYYRLTLGASRLQEVLADRLAVERYGASSLIEGLHHVVRRDIEFRHLTSKAVTDAIRGNAATAAFYAPSKAIVGDDRLDIESEVRDALQQPTTDFDSHPGMMDRIALARRLGVDRPLGSGAVITLFGEMIKQLGRDMVQLINDDLQLQVRLLKEHDAEVLKKINRALEVQASVELLEARATIYYRQGQVQKAIEDLDLILTHCPGDLATLFSRSNVYETEKQYAKAVEDLRRLKTRGNELPRDLRFKVALRLGTCLLRLRQLKEAAAEFDEALRLAPNSLNAVLGRLEAAAALGTLGAQSEQSLLQRAIEAWPEMRVIDPLVEAGGLTKLLADERKRSSLREPTVVRQLVEPATRPLRWLAAAAVGCAAIAAGVLALVVWNGSPTEDSNVVAAPVAGVPVVQSEALAQPTPDETVAVIDGPAAEESAVPAIATTSAPDAALPPSTADEVTTHVARIDSGGAPAVVSTEVAPVVPVETPEVAVETEEAESSVAPVDTEPVVETAVAEVQPEPSEPAPVAEPVVASLPVEPIRRQRPGPPRREVTLVRIPDVKPRSSRRAMRSAANDPDSAEARLRRIAMAMHSYQDVYRTFPVKLDRKWLDANGKPYLSWRVHILPFLDETTLYEQFKLDEPWDSLHNRELLRHMPDAYRSSLREKEETRFATVIADYAIFGAERPMSFAHMIDGAAHTVLLIQTSAKQAVPWTKPEDLAVDLEHPRRAWGSTREILCVMADGSPLRLPGTVPDELLAALLTAQGREVLDVGTVRRYAAYQRGERYVSPQLAHDHEQHMLKQVGMALLNFHDSRKQFPSAGPLTEATSGRGMQLSWRVHLLPYLEMGNLYKQFHLDEPWDSLHNKPLVQYMPDVYRDADDSLDSITTRIMVMTGPGTPFVDRRHGPSMRHFRDGTSKTILALQAAQESAVIWTKPDDLLFDPSRPLAGLVGVDPRVGLLVVMADGAVRTLSPGVEGDYIRKLVTPDGGEVVGEE